MNQTSKELLKLLQEVRRHTKKDALVVMKGLTPEGQNSLLAELRMRVLEASGQSRLPLGSRETFRDAPAAPAAPAASVASVKAKKVPYTVLLPPAMLEDLKDLSEVDGDPVSHHIRTAIKAYLSRRR